MPIFKLKDNFTVNDAELDGHHKHLFDIFNRLYDNCIEADNNCHIQTTLNDLLSYTDYHFKAEEKYMAEKGYRDIEHHIRLHDHFIARLNELKNSAGDEEIDTVRELVAFLGTWLLQHVLKEDKKYGSGEGS